MTNLSQNLAEGGIADKPNSMYYLQIIYVPIYWNRHCRMKFIVIDFVALFSIVQK